MLERFKRRLAGSEKDVIRIELEDGDGDVTRSKVGGKPYWPKNTEYPDMIFIAQINLEEVPETEMLPKKGMLKFFVSNESAYGLFDGADGYKLNVTKIQNNDGSTTGCGKTTVVYLTKNSYPHVGLYNGEVYSYKVQAYINATSSGDPSVEDYDKVLSDFSDTRTATVGELLGVPQDLALKTADGKIDVSWSKVSGAEGYELYYQCNDGTWKKVDVSGTKFSHTRLNNGDVYNYYVRL